MQLMIMHFLYQHVFFYISCGFMGGVPGVLLAPPISNLKKSPNTKTFHKKMSFANQQKTTSLIPNLKKLNNSLKECDMS